MSFASEYLRSSLPAVDLRGFFAAVQDAWRLWLDAKQAPDWMRPELVEDFPKERHGSFDNRFVLITFQVVGSEIAGTAPDGVSRKPQGVQIREMYDSPEKTGYKKVEMAWRELATVQFTVHAKYNKEANLWCEEFQQMMLVNAFLLKFFRARGVEHFEFWQRLADRKTSEFGQELETRPLQYRIRLEHLFMLDAKTLERIYLTVSGSGESILALEAET